MIHFRTFRNTDPPALVRIWNEAAGGRGVAPLRSASLLEYFLLAKPYFDPAGLLVAEDDGVLAGWALAGFGPAAGEGALDTSSGVVCLLAVLPGHRGRGVGTGLLRHCEAYLRGRGAREVFAGPQEPLNPFGFGIYGGSGSPGFLDSDRSLGPFLQRLGYRPARTVLVLQRHLDRPFTVIDGRFPSLRKRFEVRQVLKRGAATWFQEGVRGPLEVEEFVVEEKGTGRAAGRVLVWEMEPFVGPWNEHPVGVLHVEVDEAQRREGLARLLLANVLRFYHDQYFTLAEAHAPQGDAAAAGLLRGLGFQQVDAGHLYRCAGQE